MSDEPVMRLKASRIADRAVFPNEIRIYEDRVEEHKPGVVRRKSQSITFKQVAQVSLKRGIPWATLTIESTGGHTINVTGLSRSEANEAKAAIEARLGRAIDDQPVTTSATDPTTTAAELARLGELKQQGLLTEEEFAAAKKSLLGL
jgi:hypothetical protein